MSILQATAVTKDYSGRTGVGNRVLRGVDLAVEAGQFVAVMGPSGSGKTTLLNILSGMDRPTSGSVSVSGHDISAMTEKDLAALRLRRLGFVFQSPHLMRTLSLLDNVVLPGFLAGDEPRAEIVARGRALMDDMGIADLAKSDVTQVSGGQLQRAGICRALINEPEILIGDEPTGALNSAAAAQILDILDRVRSRGTTVVLVTHDPAVAVRALSPAIPPWPTSCVPPWATASGWAARPTATGMQTRAAPRTARAKTGTKSPDPCRARRHGRPVLHDPRGVVLPRIRALLALPCLPGRAALPAHGRCQHRDEWIHV